MTAVRTLNKFYGGFFSSCFDLTVSPYTWTYSAFMRNRINPDFFEVCFGVANCIALSTLVPILPAATLFTGYVAGTLALLAIASAIIAYPIALIIDAVKSASSAPPIGVVVGR